MREGSSDDLQTSQLFDASLPISRLLTERLEDPTHTGGSRDPTEPPPFYGYCPQAAGPVSRPSSLTVVNERLAELTDRAGALLGSKRGSADLRDGLSLLFPESSESHLAIPLLSQASDRREGDFDYAAAAALLTAARAYKNANYREVSRWAGEAARLDDDDPAPLALRGSAAMHLSDSRTARAALERAYALAPDEPGIAVALGRLLSRTEELDVAIEALDAYLATAEHDAVIAGLRARLEIRRDLLVDFGRESRFGVTIRWSNEVSDQLAESAHATVIESLDNAATLLGVERRQELTVFVYAVRTDILAATCVQSWARAVYDGALHLDGEGLERSSRVTRHIAHETLHAQLHDAAPSSPLWFQEGLAQHFARQRSSRHEASYRFMVSNRTWIPFASLEGSFQVISDSDDAQLAYHQSLAMVELLVDRHGERVFSDAVRFLRAGGDSGELLSHLTRPDGLSGSELLDFLARDFED